MLNTVLIIGLIISLAGYGTTKVFLKKYQQERINFVLIHINKYSLRVAIVIAGILTSYNL